MAHPPGSETRALPQRATKGPKTRISPDSGTPPWMMSLSTRRLFGRQRAHRQRVDLLAHPIAERRVDELVALDPALAAEGLAHDQGLEMLTVAKTRTRAH